MTPIRVNYNGGVEIKTCVFVRRVSLLQSRFFTSPSNVSASGRVAALLRENARFCDFARLLYCRSPRATPFVLRVRVRNTETNKRLNSLKTGNANILGTGVRRGRGALRKPNEPPRIRLRSRAILVLYRRRLWRDAPLPTTSTTHTRRNDFRFSSPTNGLLSLGIHRP